MVTKLKNYKPKPRKPKRTKYPWMVWLRVGTFRLKKGKDFRCKLPTMADNIRRAAAKAGKKVKIWLEADTQTVVYKVSKT